MDSQQVKIISMDENRVAKCGRCGANIVWAVTLKGAKMPMQTIAVADYCGAPTHDEATGKDYWLVSADRTHFPHCGK